MIHPLTSYRQPARTLDRYCAEPVPIRTLPDLLYHLLPAIAEFSMTLPRLRPKKTLAKDARTGCRPCKAHRPVRRVVACVRPSPAITAAKLIYNFGLD